MTLFDLKVGDEVVCDASPYKTIEKVVRVTSTQIILRNDRFKKSNGRRVKRAKWDFTRIYPADDPGVIAQIKEKGKRDHLIDKIEGEIWDHFPTDTLVKIVGLIEEYKASQVQREKP